MPPLVQNPASAQISDSCPKSAWLWPKTATIAVEASNQVIVNAFKPTR